MPAFGSTQHESRVVDLRGGQLKGAVDKMSRQARVLVAKRFSGYAQRLAKLFRIDPVHLDEAQQDQPDSRQRTSGSVHAPQLPCEWLPTAAMVK
jgi:hypothetical protein